MKASDRAWAFALVASPGDDIHQRLCAYGSIVHHVYGEPIAMRVGMHFYPTKLGLDLLMGHGLLTAEEVARCGEMVEAEQVRQAADKAERERLAPLCRELGVPVLNLTAAELKGWLATHVEWAERQAVAAQARADQAKAYIDTAKARQARGLAVLGEA